MSTPAAQVRSALATLPLSFPNPADVTIVDGSSDWPAEVRRAVGSGAGAIVIVHPRPAEFADLLALESRAPVVVDSPWASNPVIDTARHAFDGAAGNSLECRAILPPGTD